MRWVLLVVSILVSAPLPALGDGQDYPGLGHIKGYHLDSYSERGFDAVSFEAAPGKKLEVEGHKIYIMYYADDRITHASSMEIYLNYMAILKSLKAEILRAPNNLKDSGENMLARFYRNEKPVYVNINPDSDGIKYQLLIVEQKEFQPSVVTSPGE